MSTIQPMNEVELYVKVQIGGVDENVVIISFKKR